MSACHWSKLRHVTYMNIHEGITVSRGLLEIISRQLEILPSAFSVGQYFELQGNNFQ